MGIKLYLIIVALLSFCSFLAKPVYAESILNKAPASGVYGPNRYLSQNYLDGLDTKFGVTFSDKTTDKSKNDAVIANRLYRVISTFILPLTIILILIQIATRIILRIVNNDFGSHYSSSNSSHYNDDDKCIKKEKKKSHDDDSNSGGSSIFF